MLNNVILILVLMLSFVTKIPVTAGFERIPTKLIFSF